MGHLNIDQWTKDEMRFFRREWISYHLHIGMTLLSRIKWNTRFNERGTYGIELKAYVYYEYH